MKMTTNTWEYAPDLYEGAAAIAKLAKLGLKHEALVMAVQRSEIERLGCSVFEPRLAAPIKAWAAAFRVIAEESVLHGWRKTEQHNLPRIVNDEFRVAVAVISGDEATALKHRTPKSKTPRGMQSLSFVRFNQKQVAMFPELEGPENDDEVVTYWLLIFSDGKGALRAELSLPMDMDAENRLCAWKERILLALPEPNAAVLRTPEDEEPLDLDVVVKPKS